MMNSCLIEHLSRNIGVFLGGGGFLYRFYSHRHLSEHASINNNPSLNSLFVLDKYKYCPPVIIDQYKVYNSQPKSRDVLHKKNVHYLMTLYKLLPNIISSWWCISRRMRRYAIQCSKPKRDTEQKQTSQPYVDIEMYPSWQDNESFNPIGTPMYKGI